MLTGDRTPTDDSRATEHLAVAWEDAAQRPAARALAQRLLLRVSSLDEAQADYLLVFTSERLELRATAADAPGPVYVDFAGGGARHRRLHGGGRREALARAVGIRSGPPRVVDATAGLGRDAFVLASLGCHVVLLERSPVLAALLRDGLRRAAQDPDIGDWIEQRMSLIEGEALDHLRVLSGETRPDVVYLDPMYPQRKKSALVKKELRLLRAVIGPQDDPGALLEAACGAAMRRVVVKRPKTAPPLPGPRPDTQIVRASTRYDIYLA